MIYNIDVSVIATINLEKAMEAESESEAREKVFGNLYFGNYEDEIMDKIGDSMDCDWDYE
jgi:hypothetical protein